MVCDTQMEAALGGQALASERSRPKFSGDQQGPMKNVPLPFGLEWCSKLTHLESSPALILEVSECLVKGGDFQ